MKKLILPLLFCMVATLSCAQFTFNRVASPDLLQYAKGDTLKTSVRGDSASFNTTKSKFTFNKQLYFKGDTIPTITQVRAIAGAGLSLGETSTTAYRGDRGKIAYDFTQGQQITSAAQLDDNVNGLKYSDENNEFPIISGDWETTFRYAITYGEPKYRCQVAYCRFAICIRSQSDNNTYDPWIKITTAQDLSDSLENYVSLNGVDTIKGFKEFQKGVEITNTKVGGNTMLNVLNSDNPNIVGVGIATNSTLPALSVDNTGTGYAIDAYNINVSDQVYFNGGADSAATKAYARSLAPDLSNYVDLSTPQTITGVKTHSNGLITTTIKNTAGTTAMTTSTTGSGTLIHTNTGTTAMKASSTGVALYEPSGVKPLVNFSSATGVLLRYKGGAGTEKNAIQIADSVLTIYRFKNANSMITARIDKDSLSFSNPNTLKAALSLLNGFNIFRYPSGQAGIILTDPIMPFYGFTGKLWMEHQAEVATSIKYANATSTEAINVGVDNISIKDNVGNSRLYTDASGTSIYDEIGGDFMYSSLGDKYYYGYNNGGGSVELMNSTSGGASYKGYGGVSFLDAFEASNYILSPYNSGSSAIDIDSTLIFYEPKTGEIAITIKNDSVLFRKPTNLVQYAYGGIYVEDGVTSQNVPTGATYTKMTAFTTSETNYNVTSEADSLVVLVSGMYKIEGSFSLSSGTANVNTYGAAFKNNTELGNIHFERKIGAASDVGACSFSGKVYLTAGDRISFRMRTDDAGTVAITIHYANLGINLMRAY